MTDAIGDRFFRHEHGRLLAVLVRRFGAARLEAVEDAVQWALLAAVDASVGPSVTARSQRAAAAR